MKKYIIIFIIGLISRSGYSQNVQRGEYFIDNDPGLGMGQSFSILSPDSDIFHSLIIPFTDFSLPGYHFVYIRVRDDNGSWSHTIRRLVQVDENLQSLNVVAIEYFFETDQGFNNNLNTSLISSTDSSWHFSIPYSELPLNWQLSDTVFLRVKNDLYNRWSMTAFINESADFSGIPPLSNQSLLSAYPNPFTDNINIVLKELAPFRVLIYDSEGKLIESRKASTAIQIDTKNYSNGLYHLFFYTETNRIYTTTLVKSE